MQTVLGRHVHSGRIAIVFGLLLGMASSIGWGAARPGTELLTAKAHMRVLNGAALPDLAIESVELKLGERCGPAAPLLFVTARVTNHGKGPIFSNDWSGTVYAMERSTEGWGNGLRLPAMARGTSKSVTFPIYYLQSAANEMTGTHQFFVGVAIDSIEESDYTNNHFGPISITIPGEFCTD
ncbi:MAG: hypothetical protein OES09_02165 [Gammaproteobacteria bacterium]|nr:hypothetical protein [Gammaproteobacteria bacterium]